MQDAANFCLSGLISLKASCLPWQFMGSHSWGFLGPVPRTPYYSSLYFSKAINPRKTPNLSGPQHTS